MLTSRGRFVGLSLAVGLIAGACAGPPPAAACVDPSGPIDPDAPAPDQSRPPASPAALGLYGKVYECGGAPVADVCITVGVPGNICWARTDRDGNYTLDLDGIVDPTVKSFFSLTFAKTGYVSDRSKSFEFTTTKIQRIDHRMRR